MRSWFAAYSRLQVRFSEPPMDTRSGGARSVMPDMSHALEDVVVVHTRRCRSSRTRPMVTASFGVHSVMPELPYPLDDGTAVTCLHSMLTNGQIILRIGLGIGLASRGSFWGSTREVVEISFLLYSFLSLEDALFLLCPWFSHEVFLHGSEY